MSIDDVLLYFAMFVLVLLVLIVERRLDELSRKHNKVVEFLHDQATMNEKFIEDIVNLDEELTITSRDTQMIGEFLDVCEMKYYDVDLMESKTWRDM
jgi:hypothetical protein